MIGEGGKTDNAKIEECCEERPGKY